MQIFARVTVSFRAGKKWAASGFSAKSYLQEPKLQVLGLGGFLCKFKSSANKGKHFPYYQRGALGAAGPKQERQSP